MCVAVPSIGNIKWFVLEGQQEGNDTTLFAIVCGIYETEYGYVPANELESIEVNGYKYGFDKSEKSSAIIALPTSSTSAVASDGNPYRLMLSRTSCSVTLRITS